MNQKPPAVKAGGFFIEVVLCRFQFRFAHGVE
jgi:hypothetical protein